MAASFFGRSTPPSAPNISAVEKHLVEMTVQNLHGDDLEPGVEPDRPNDWSSALGSSWFFAVSGAAPPWEQPRRPVLHDAQVFDDSMPMRRKNTKGASSPASPRLVQKLGLHRSPYACEHTRKSMKRKSETLEHIFRRCGLRNPIRPRAGRPVPRVSQIEDSHLILLAVARIFPPKSLYLRDFPGSSRARDLGLDFPDN